MTNPRAASVVAALAALALLSASPPAAAQLATDPGASGAGRGLGGQGSGRHGGRHWQGGQRAAAGALAPLPPVRDPWPRLDAGALLCRTEADLQQHQLAVAARIGGADAPEPSGCRLVHAMTAVTVVERHGPARTEVRLPGDGQPEQLGWTDAAIPAEPPPTR